ncbi:MAG: ATP-binding protein, partial [Ktedonobacterales bacterium]
MSAERDSLYSSHVTSFAALLRRYRTAAGLTQEGLAARAGLSTRAISDLERGQKQTPRRETVQLIADALDLSAPKRALLEAAVRPTMAPAHSVEAAAPAPHNLPAQLDTLIGRERETVVASDLLARMSVRVLTLTGPGGVGKTRLALQVAEDVLGYFDDGVYVTMLAALQEPDLVMRSIADTLGLRAKAGVGLAEQVHTHLRDKQMLLVLDNFEHLLEAAPQISELLSACPRVKVLVTSRAPLRIGGEHEVPVAPLAGDAAADLFLRRARASNPALAVGEDELAVVEAICERLDRLPLAIELAAVWTKVLPLPGLLEQLAHSLERLTGGRRDAPERQRTLRDAIEWSERLLGDDEQRLFHRVAIFAGGFTTEAAVAICGETAENGHVLDVLANLVEQALLQSETQHDVQGDVRFWMLETIREYALERLRASGEMEGLARRHAEYYAKLVREQPWGGADQDSRDRRIEREMPNVRVTLEWARAHGASVMGLGLATALGLFWYSHGSFDEGERWLNEFLALDGASEEQSPERLRVMALYFLTLYALDRHDFARGEALAREGVELARRQGDASGAGNMLTELGHVAEARGDREGAMALYEEGLLQYRAGGNFGSVGRVLSSLGNVARALGDYERARRYLEESLAWARERHFAWAVASGLVSLGHLACEQEDFARARQLYREGLDMYRTMRNPTALAWCLNGVAVVLAAGGRYERVARLCGAI